jgi:DNA-binding LacI/PurR family transcriptional regulator
VEIPQPATAAFASSDLTAIGLIEGLRGLGKTVPQDFSVCAFDSFGIAPDFEPRLTVVQQPNRQVGRLAFEMLLRLIQAEESPPVPIMLTPQLSLGSSTARYR